MAELEAITREWDELPELDTSLGRRESRVSIKFENQGEEG